MSGSGFLLCDKKHLHLDHREMENDDKILLMMRLMMIPMMMPMTMVLVVMMMVLMSMMTMMLKVSLVKF